MDENSVAAMGHAVRLCNRHALPAFEFDVELFGNPLAAALENRTWVAITSSHLGKSVSLHAEVCRYISRSVLQARHCGHVILIAAGSAVESWADRAAELFAVPSIGVQVLAADERIDDRDTDSAKVFVRMHRPIGRDAVVAALGDRVDCVLARPGGNIDASLRRRLKHGPPATTRVAIHSPNVASRAQVAARELMRRGAIGWYLSNTRSPLTDNRPADVGGEIDDTPTAVDSVSPAIVDPDWACTDGRWLVHCTRGRQGPWPGQSEQQHRDSLLLADRDDSGCLAGSPLDSLRRIARVRRLVGCALATNRRWPVVCFSERSLASLLSDRRYRPHLHRWDYEPYGVAIRTSAARRAGLRPVLYGDQGERATLAPSDQYRFQARGTTFDWTAEREWRMLGDLDLSRFSRDDVRLFVRHPQEAAGNRWPFPISVVGRWAT
ncbi:hypothetical protein FYK55_18800 [Roseiconus nitratireducens]|uniref:Uncharacterized protein n=1 Tax=Roseiconus nitratireducens TaxID=2605748 RepID=A0A5M6D0E9_9BACT|nr:hypothetical protein [Roseiconus nitratireducens]KAA5540957.1 hypothetical protein FYK55_18800 [Roseiconus nitratireducens]